MKKYIECIIMLGLFIPCVSFAELKDPRTRNEDVSGAVINASVEQRSDGFYEYTYGIVSPITNKGIISSFAVDLSCDIEFGDVVFPGAPDPKARAYSKDGGHVPAQVYGKYGNLVMPAIDARNQASWTLWLKPGHAVSGARIISPAPPVMRRWTIEPYMTADGWDYSGYGESPATDLLWIPDFTVTGLAMGPACAPDL